MGGSLSLIAAEHAKVDAAVTFYGTPASKKELSHVRAPSQHFVCPVLQQQRSSINRSTQPCIRLTQVWDVAAVRWLRREQGQNPCSNMDVVDRQSLLFYVELQTRQLSKRVRMGVQPEAIKVPVQMHGGQEDSMNGLSDPQVRAFLLADLGLRMLQCCANDRNSVLQEVASRGANKSGLTRAAALTCWRACVQTVTKFAEDIKKAGGSAELFIYPGEGHAFMVRGALVPVHVRQASGTRCH